MAIIETIKIDDQDVKFKASAAIPRLYRIKFHRDIYHDMKVLMKDITSDQKKKLEAAAESGDEELANEIGSEISIETLEIFENIAYMMAYHADPENVSTDPLEWLDQFNTFSVYEISPKLLDMWALNTNQMSKSKKNKETLIGK